MKRIGLHPLRNLLVRGPLVCALIGFVSGVGSGSPPNRSLARESASHVPTRAQTWTWSFIDHSYWQAAQVPAGKPAPPKLAAPKKKAAAARVPVNIGKGLEEKGTASSPETTELTLTGRRDPFKLPTALTTPGVPASPETMGPLPPGNRGLVIDQLVLEGVVRQETTNTQIAVVTNASKRAYFLRENDAVYNGVVSKITLDSVTFSENALDQNGRVHTHDVVKRLSPAPGEGR